MYMTRCPRTSQTAETKSIIRKIKRAIDNGAEWREAIAEVETIKDSIQREKARKAIIDYINPWKTEKEPTA